MWRHDTASLDSSGTSATVHTTGSIMFWLFGRSSSLLLVPPPKPLLEFGNISTLYFLLGSPWRSTLGCRMRHFRLFFDRFLILPCGSIRLCGGRQDSLVFLLGHYYCGLRGIPMLLWLTLLFGLVFRRRRPWRRWRWRWRHCQPSLSAAGRDRLEVARSGRHANSMNGVYICSNYALLMHANLSSTRLFVVAAVVVSLSLALQHDI